MASSVASSVGRHGRALVLMASLLLLSSTAFSEEERANFFDDPFLQVTGAITDCPQEPGPLISRAEMLRESHSRIERGTSCFRSGRCRLRNSYLYDKEIIPRAKQAILADGRFANSSVWVEGQRRWVWLKGCVRTQADAQAMEKVVRDIDDVEAVVNQLVVRKP